MLTSGSENGNSFALFSNLWESPCAINQTDPPLYQFPDRICFGSLSLDGIAGTFLSFTFLPNPVARVFLLVETPKRGLVFKQPVF